MLGSFVSFTVVLINIITNFVEDIVTVFPKKKKFIVGRKRNQNSLYIVLENVVSKRSIMSHSYVLFMEGDVNFHE